MTLPSIKLFINTHLYVRHSSKRASSCIPKAFRQTGSITIEASLAMPLFFLAVISLVYMMEVMSIRIHIRSGMQSAAKQTAKEAYVRRMTSGKELEQKIVEAIGSERLDRSIIVGGSSGINCQESFLSPVNSILELRAAYKVKLPVPAFTFAAVPMKETIRVKGWTGYEKSGFSGTGQDIVYVTETGMVYHRDYHCTYLELSIHMVPALQVDNLRNKSEGKYYPCERCAKGSSGTSAYITDYGDRYHNSLNCSGLKRTVYAVPITEAAGKGACKKCGD